MDWMILPLRRYAQFYGRSRRKEFWMWVLFLILASVLLSILDSVLGLGGSVTTQRTVGPSQFSYGYGAAMRGGVLTNIFSLATFLPNLAVQVRRLHDTGRSGWWVLLPILPIIVGAVLLVAAALGSPGLLVVGGVLVIVGGLCAILLLVWFCTDGTRGPNRYGGDPKGVADLGEVFR